MYSQILKKKKKMMGDKGNLSEMDINKMSEEDMPEEEYETSEENETYGKPMKVGKKAMHHAMAAMAPEGVMEEEKKAMNKKSIMPEAKIEIELMLEGAKKKKTK